MARPSSSVVRPSLLRCFVPSSSVHPSPWQSGRPMPRVQPELHILTKTQDFCPLAVHMLQTHVQLSAAKVSMQKQEYCVSSHVGTVRWMAPFAIIIQPGAPQYLYRGGGLHHWRCRLGQRPSLSATPPIPACHHRDGSASGQSHMAQGVTVMCNAICFLIALMQLAL